MVIHLTEAPHFVSSSPNMCFKLLGGFGILARRRAITRPQWRINRLAGNVLRIRL